MKKLSSHLDSKSRVKHLAEKIAGFNGIRIHVVRKTEF